MDEESENAREVADAQGSAHRPKHKRKYAPKVRTGCITCKVRRKKCDEEKPVCRRCKEGGFRCDGYSSISKTPNSKERKNNPTALIEHDNTTRPSTNSTITEGSRAVIRLLPRLPPTKNLLEQHCLGHFFAHTLHEIDLSLGINGFWLKTLPALSQNEPLVRHAVTALGATHWLFVNRNSAMINHPGPYHTVATQQFTRSISSLVPLMSQAKPENTILVLICCLLFVYIETLRGSQTEALRHLTAGCRLLSSLRDSPPELERKVREIATLFRGLGAVVNMFNEDKIIPDLASFAQPLGGYDDPTKPYESLDEAEEALAQLDLFLSDIHCTQDKYEGPFPQRIKEMNQETFRVTVRRFRKWEVRFEKTLETLKPIQNYKLLNLQIQRRIWGRMAEQTYDEEPVIDMKECMSIMDQVQELLEMTSPTHRVFTPNANIVPILILLYGSCADVEVRKRAVSLLQSRNRREAVWDSEEAARFLQLDLDKCLTGQKASDWPKLGPSTAQEALLVFRPKS